MSKTFQYKLYELLISIPIVNTSVGSTDGNKAIWNEYTTKHPNIFIVSQFKENDSHHSISAQNAMLELSVYMEPVKEFNMTLLNKIGNEINKSLNKNPQKFNEIDFKHNDGLRVNKFRKVSKDIFFDESKKLWVHRIMYEVTLAENDDYTIDYQNGTWP